MLKSRHQGNQLSECCISWEKRKLKSNCQWLASQSYYKDYVSWFRICCSWFWMFKGGRFGTKATWFATVCKPSRSHWLPVDVLAVWYRYSDDLQKAVGKVPHLELDLTDLSCASPSPYTVHAPASFRICAKLSGGPLRSGSTCMCTLPSTDWICRMTRKRERMFKNKGCEPLAYSISIRIDSIGTPWSVEIRCVHPNWT